MRVIALGDREPSLRTHREIDAALDLMGGEFGCSWVATDSAEARDLTNVDAVWLLPGSPYREDRAAYDAIQHCLA